MNETSPQDRRQLDYWSRGMPKGDFMPEPERLPAWKVFLIILFFVPPAACLLLSLLLGD